MTLQVKTEPAPDPRQPRIDQPGARQPGRERHQIRQARSRRRAAERPMRAGDPDRGAARGRPGPAQRHRPRSRHPRERPQARGGALRPAGGEPHRCRVPVSASAWPRRSPRSMAASCGLGDAHPGLVATLVLPARAPLDSGLLSPASAGDGRGTGADAGRWLIDTDSCRRLGRAGLRASHARVAARRGGAGEALRATRTTLLSPFDPIVWDRACAGPVRFRIYDRVLTPAPKRKYGYYVLPSCIAAGWSGAWMRKPTARAACSRSWASGWSQAWPLSPSARGGAGRGDRRMRRLARHASHRGGAEVSPGDWLRSSARPWPVDQRVEAGAGTSCTTCRAALP